MKKWAALLVVLSGFMCTVLEAQANVLVLAHGYLSDASVWESTGITQQLEQSGWQRAGILITSPAGVRMMPGPGQSADNKVYLAQLPSTAPLGIQGDHLQAMLLFLANRHPKEKLILVGHSVGGVVARLVLVRSPIPNVAALMTIASPHLGTPLAEEALDATSSIWPVEVFKDIFGGGQYQTLKYSRGLYMDIVRPRHGSLLYWLNGQSHPPIKYFSVVRNQPFVLWGDLLVPGTSQDMNHIPAIAGRSKLYTMASGHVLNPGDGMLLTQILKEFE